MILNGYSLSLENINEMKELKNSPAYGTYLKGIAKSPIFNVILEEHIKNVDVTDDIKELQNQKKIPESVNSKAISDLFKISFMNVAINLVADAIILKEIEEVNIAEVKDNLVKSSNIEYLLGNADKSMYSKVKSLVDSGEVGQETLAYKGLVEYMKKNKDIKFEIENKKPSTPITKESKTKNEIKL